MLAKVYSCALIGLEGAVVEVEPTSTPALCPRSRWSACPMPRSRNPPSGCAAAIFNSGLSYPRGRLTVNLAPADLRKEGPAYDLPIAVALLILAEQMPADLEGVLFLGELSLDGSVRHVNGVLPMAHLAHELGYKSVFVPQADAPEAALVEGIDVYPVDTPGPAGRALPRLPPHRAVSRRSCDLDADPPTYAATSRTSKDRSTSSGRWKWPRPAGTTC